ncbi:MAG: acyltransferase family protein [Rhodomicrobium sp.]|nr:acyltransferase family protein [Rhodomicrobium sp.]
MAGAEARERDATWDIARGIGMVLVIWGHFLEPVYPARPDLGREFASSAFAQWQVIYSFHMMLFFFVSGAVNRNLTKKLWPDVLRGSLRLLALAWVVHILGVLFAMATGFAPEATRSLWDAAFAIGDPIAEGFLWSVGVLWFLTSLCFVQLLAYLSLRNFPALAVVLVAMAATAITVYLPDQYLLKTWLPGLSFFALGYLFSQWQVRWPFWAAIPLIAAVILLAPLNHGCTFSLTQICEGSFGVRMFAGSYGFLPLFFLSSLVGSLAAVCLSAGLARFRASKILAYAGRRSLELFIINGFVATFLPSYIAQIPWPHLTVLHYIALAIGVVAAHLLALQVLRPVLARIDSAALAISGFLVRILVGVLRSIQPKTA